MERLSLCSSHETPTGSWSQPRTGTHASGREWKGKEKEEGPSEEGDKGLLPVARSSRNRTRQKGRFT